jgi:hypothetical protein
MGTWYQQLMLRPVHVAVLDTQHLALPTAGFQCSDGERLLIAEPPTRNDQAIAFWFHWPRDYRVP